jgi:hypothetical protein
MDSIGGLVIGQKYPKEEFFAAFFKYVEGKQPSFRSNHSFSDVTSPRCLDAHVYYGIHTKEIPRTWRIAAISERAKHGRQIYIAVEYEEWEGEIIINVFD